MVVVSTRPGIVVRFPTKFPARVLGTSPIVVTQTGAIFTFSLDLAALIATGLFPYVGVFFVATLPASPEGSVARASNGRKIGEGIGAGTGVYVYRSGGAWLTFSLDQPVLA